MDRLQTPERVGLDVDLAGVGARALAVIVDSVIVLLGLAVLFAALVLSTPLLGHWAWILGILGFTLVQWFYYACFEALWHGQTPGKRAVGLRVQKVGGYPIGWPEALIRNFLRATLDLVVFLPVGIIVMLLTRRSQRIGDLVAGTVVVRERQGGLAELERIGYSRTMEAHPLPAGGGPELTLEEFETVHEFLARRELLDPDRRNELAARLARAIQNRLTAQGADSTPWQGLGAEEFLRGVHSGYRDEAAG